jgi:apolipoprotein N-acyltransferase
MNKAGKPLLKLYLPALLAGALAPLSFSPLEWWPLALLSVAVLYYLLQKTTTRQAAITGWWYGAGFFGVGASWVFVSINVYGNASTVLAGFLTLLFVAGLALCFVLQCWLYRKWGSSIFPVLGFAAFWVLGEWFRSWFLTGFPWLYLGYAHVTTAISGVAPVLGVYGLSLLVAFSSAALAQLFILHRSEQSLPMLIKTRLPLALAVIWLAALASTPLKWVEPVANSSLAVGIVQANIDQNQKFGRDYIQNNLDSYEELSLELWQNDMVLWPETAIPLVYQNAGEVLDYFTAMALRNNSTLVSGIFYEDGSKTYNSIAVMGNGSGIAHKRKLVPFGEYIPLQAVMANLMQIFDLPMSALARAPAQQELLTIKDLQAASFICYEVVYPELVRKQAITADFLLTISNDTWFGASWGPLQHLQMAAMRARENGRYMVRGTNNGVSALINERGEIIASTKQFTAETLQGEIKLFTGRTPYSYWGSWPVLGFCLMVLLATCYPRRQPHDN